MLKCRDFRDKACAQPEAPHFLWGWVSPRYWGQWLGLVALSLLWLFLPGTWRDFLGKRIGVFLAKGRMPRRIPTNLQRCFPDITRAEIDAIILEFCQAQACCVLDMPALWLASPKKLMSRVHITGLEHLEAQYNGQPATCLLVCHSLGMEHAARALKWSYPMLGYYQPFGVPVVDWLVYRSRVKNGGYLLRRGQSMRSLVRDLRQGWMLYMMIDEDMGEREGCWSDFFATQKCGIKSPAKLARLGGAEAVAVYSWYDLEQRQYEIVISAPLEGFPSGDDQADVDQLMDALETMIGHRVAQYRWSQQLFRSAP